MRGTPSAPVRPPQRPHHVEPADDARFTVYVVIHAPQVDGGGGSVAGPVFSRIMGYVLGRYGVEPTGGKPSRLPVEW